MSPHQNNLSSTTSNYSPVIVTTSNGTPFNIESIGDFENENLRLKFLKNPNVRCIPNLSLHLLSMSQIADHGSKDVSSQGKCWIHDQISNKMIRKGIRRDDL